MKPESSSREGVSLSGVSRGGDRCSAWDKTASISSSGVALLTEDRRAVLRMLVERGVDLVVEVVQQRRRAPELLVLAELLRVGADRRLHRERLPLQGLALRVLGQRLPGALTGHVHGRAI